MICYVNGYWNRVIGVTRLAPSAPGEAYWNHFDPDFLPASRRMVESEMGEPRCFIDGSSQFVVDQPAAIRYQHGFEYGRLLPDDWSKNDPHNEIIKIISHSEGCAFAAGMADSLVNDGLKVERMLYLSPKDPLAFAHPANIYGVQVHYANDPICPPHPIKGINFFIRLEQFEERKASVIQAHGATLHLSTLLRVQEILSAKAMEKSINQLDAYWEITESDSRLAYRSVR